MKKVLLLDLKSYYDSPAYQMALLVAYACLDERVKENIDFEFSEQPRSNPANEIVRDIIDSGAMIVAMSNYSWNYKKICEILTILDGMKEAGESVPSVLLGGPNSAGKFGVNMMYQFKSISAMVEGEGEPAFRDLCGALVDGNEHPFRGARNTIYREDDEVIKPTQLHRIQRLDEVPSPYLEGIIPLKPAPLFYETNRGCPYRCTFCYWGNGNSKVYRMSHERVREEFEFFAKNKVGALFLADANFGIFPGDLDIARIICEINEKYGRPFKYLGVNWAKNSSDRILDIATVFAEGGISVSTTLAIQSVTPEAEIISKRYAMPPSRFINLIKNAELRSIDTYTDIIWGLPGEGYSEFLHGLEAVMCSAVPSMLIHQLSLLPGTELYEQKDELKLELVSDRFPELVVDSSTMSDYAEYIVISHAKMNYEEMQRGTRMMGIAHFMHNHGLGRIPNLYLKRYGLKMKTIFSLFDEVLLGKHAIIFKEHDDFIQELNKTITAFAVGTGNDETIFYRNLSELIWFDQPKDQFRQVRSDHMKDFLQDFYEFIAYTTELQLSKKEQEWLNELVHFGWLLSPKPTWKPKEEYDFSLDVLSIWEDMLSMIFEFAISEDQAKENKKAGVFNEWDNWLGLSDSLESKIQSVITDDYMMGRSRDLSVKIRNPWKIPPSKKNIDWLLRARSYHCAAISQETVTS